MPLRLTRDQIESFPVLAHVPSYDAVTFESIDRDNRVVFTGSREGEPDEEIAVKTVIRKDESEIWQACNSMVQFHLRSSQASVKGSFSFELIAIDIYQGLQPSDWDHLYQLIAKRAAGMQPGQSQYVFYRSLRGVLSYRAPLEWGKIVFSHAVRVFEKDPEKIDLLIKKLLKRAKTRYIVIHDISRNAILDKTNEAQTYRCRRLFAPTSDESLALPTVIYTHADMTVACNDHFSDPGSDPM